MKLCVLVPAVNEQESIVQVLRSVPRSFAGITSVDLVVIDDGSTDATAALAASAGAVVLRHPKRMGLAAAFRTGLAHALDFHADLIATLDADGQYRPVELSVLLVKMRETHADLVIGDRQVWTCAHMPLGNRIGNAIGSLMLRVLARGRITDASSGFRLFTARCAHALRITSEHTYTHEMLIQAVACGFTVAEVPVSFLPRLHGKSKLVRTLRHHILRSCGTILKSLFLFNPLRKFLILAALFALAGVAVFLRPFFSDASVTSSAFGGVLLFVFGIQFLVLGIIADSFASQRRVLIEESSVSRRPS